MLEIGTVLSAIIQFFFVSRSSLFFFWVAKRPKKAEQTGRRPVYNASSKKELEGVTQTASQLLSCKTTAVCSSTRTWSRRRRSLIVQDEEDGYEEEETMMKHAAEKDQAMDEEENCSDEDAEEAVEAEEEEEEQEFVKVDPFDDPINGPNCEQSEEEEGSSREDSQDSPFEEEDALSNIPQRFWPVPVEEAISTDLNRSQSSFDRWSSPQKKRPKTEEEHEEGEYIRGTSAPCGSSWFSRILPCIRSSVCMLSPKSLLLQKPTHLELREVRKITLTLLTHVEDAIDNERDTEMEWQRGELEAKQKDMAKKRQEAEGKLADELAEHWRTKKKLEKQQRDGDAEAERQRALLRQTVGEVSRQRAMLERKLEDLKQRHKHETEARKAEHEGKLEEMKRKLEMEMETKQKQMQMQEMEKQKYCCACKQKPREAVVIPCLHMDYCFKCLLKSRAIRNNMCPKCNRPIKGICMSAHAGTAATAAASHG